MHGPNKLPTEAESVLFWFCYKCLASWKAATSSTVVYSHFLKYVTPSDIGYGFANFAYHSAKWTAGTLTAHVPNNAPYAPEPKNVSFPPTVEDLVNEFPVDEVVAEACDLACQSKSTVASNKRESKKCGNGFHDLCAREASKVWSQSRGPKNPGSELKEELKMRRTRFNTWFKNMVETKVSGFVKDNSELGQVEVDVEMEDYAALVGDMDQPYFSEDVEEVEKSANASSVAV